jgi:type IV pilus assembly protein PilX
MGSRSTLTLNAPHKQRGVVLLIALIMMVAMTLAAIGMMRSVDTGSVIAGNMAFKKATLSASDAGMSAAFNALMSVANSNNGYDKQILNFNNGNACPANATALGTGAAGTAGCTLVGGGTVVFPGYFSTPVSPCEVPGQSVGNVNAVVCTATQSQWWTTYNWNSAPSITVTDPNNGGTIATVNYVIHRMCQLANAAPTLAATVSTAPPGTQLCQSYVEPPACHTNPCPPNITLYFYRITTRSVGVRNSVTYTQSLVLIGA